MIMDEFRILILYAKLILIDIIINVIIIVSNNEKYRYINYIILIRRIKLLRFMFIKYWDLIL